LGKEGNGLADAVYQSIQLTPMDEVPYQFPADNTSLFSQLPAELLHQISKSVSLSFPIIVFVHNLFILF